MTNDDLILSSRATEFREAFDRSFAEPVQTGIRETIDLILFRVGGAMHAIRIAEISGLYADVKITPCPSAIVELRGLAGFRGTLTPVYDLAALLGYKMSPARWIVLAKDRAVALAFDAFESHFRVEPAGIASQQSSSASRHVHEIARQADAAWPIVDIHSVVVAIKARTAATSSHKEH
jgi:purine-binding chemotaxis protein CheW